MRSDSNRGAFIVLCARCEHRVFCFFYGGDDRCCCLRCCKCFGGGTSVVRRVCLFSGCTAEANSSQQLVSSNQFPKTCVRLYRDKRHIKPTPLLPFPQHLEHIVRLLMVVISVVSPRPLYHRRAKTSIATTFNALRLSLENG